MRPASFAIAASIASIASIAPLPAAETAPHAITITGRVTEAGSGTPLASAGVVVMGSQTGAVSGSDGRYRIALPHAAHGDRIALVARLIGHEPVRRTVRLDSAGTTVDVALPRVALLLSEVTVTGVVTATTSRGGITAPAASTA
jgi:hypothetical protein